MKSLIDSPSLSPIPSPVRGPVRGRILLVDDNPYLLEISELILRGAGYAIRCAANGKQCREALQSELPDLILLDINLPDVCGLDLCREIKANPATRSVAVIHLSGDRISSEEQALGLDAGADGYLARPISNHELTARVEATLRVRRTEAELQRLTNKLRSASQALQQIMDYSLDVICTLNGQGQFLEMSAAAEKVWGFSREELVLSLIHI